jgi:tetratricopeptide (TPR) repeat protein
MTVRLIAGAIACCLVAGASVHRPSASAGDPRKQAQRATLDSVFAAYVGGDMDVVSRSFGKVADFPDRLRLNDPREFDRWLGSWDRRKALLVIEIARATADVSPRFPRVVVEAGLRYVLAAGGGELATPEGREQTQLWHRIAAGLLQRFGTSLHVEKYARDVAFRTGAPLDARLELARAVAVERYCWERRPSLNQFDVETGVMTKAAGAKIPGDMNGFPTFRETTVTHHRTCLGQALMRFESATDVEETRDEARVRGGWILFQLDRFPEALEWLDAAAPKDDRELAFWQALFRARALEKLGRHEDALSAYQAALTLSPGAQSAGVGHAILLMRLDRSQEADARARALRASTSSITAATYITTDPWLIYWIGDYRFVDRWMDQLRTAWR